jgi:hypothetical protein
MVQTPAHLWRTLSRALWQAGRDVTTIAALKSGDLDKTRSTDMPNLLLDDST